MHQSIAVERQSAACSRRKWQVVPPVGGLFLQLFGAKRSVGWVRVQNTFDRTFEELSNDALQDSISSCQVVQQSKVVFEVGDSAVYV